ncbi:hypothetical protein [Phormidium sp. FACHB-1136]|nr:hypothetical protein [Phormidium sp. FACHB-1136]
MLCVNPLRYQPALAILEPKLGADHPWTVRCRENLAKIEDPLASA